MHLDHEQLALLALGEDIDRSDADAHLARCTTCTRELHELQGVVETARYGPSADQLLEPPPRVWDRIVADLEDEAAAPARARPHRWWVHRRSMLLASVAAGLIGVLVGGLGVSLNERPEVIARTALTSLPGKAGTGSATLQRLDGGLAVHLDVSGLPAGGGYYQVWLLDPAAQKLISLGNLTSTGTGTLPLPPGLNPARYPVVDVSLEPRDGNPAHSSNSFLRGRLPT
ncbi:hypothetical protein BJF79_23680 [Actinomadura sp. CNU-125]|uniref:anti-sigma factor n=1 Tax=Actinomadura sp. CNU-125 TaxID=1904961 RepID=UPI00095CAC08|nr:anti-sigma factor [Actinomadura sp. CNU-125]OLT11724.1 hypothetical protein BJF79_23680 [Actinomadura sp. CNU-125]